MLIIEVEDEHIIKSKESKKKANKKYYNKLKETIDKIVCPICKGKYTKYSKNTHFNSQKHRLAMLEGKNEE